MIGNEKFFILLVAYFLGSIPTAYLIGKLKKIDIRKVGSGNVGATNTARVLGKRWAALVLAVDILKGVSAVLLGKAVFGVENNQSLYFVLLSGFIAVIGHIFPVWLNFRGGKGVATVGGVIIALSPLQATLALVIFMIVLRLSRYVSLSSLLGIYSLPLSFFLFFKFSEKSGLLYFFLLLAVVITIMHVKNIKRLFAGIESKTSTFVK